MRSDREFQHIAHKCTCSELESTGIECPYFAVAFFVVVSIVF